MFETFRVFRKNCALGDGVGKVFYSPSHISLSPHLFCHGRLLLLQLFTFCLLLFRYVLTRYPNFTNSLSLPSSLEVLIRQTTIKKKYICSFSQLVYQLPCSTTLQSQANVNTMLSLPLGAGQDMLTHPSGMPSTENGPENVHTSICLASGHAAKTILCNKSSQGKRFIRIYKIHVRSSPRRTCVPARRSKTTRSG